jgi:serine/threonine protein kinase
MSLLPQHVEHQVTSPQRFSCNNLMEMLAIFGVLALSSISCKFSINKVRLCGFPPFYDENNQKLFKKILKADYSFPTPYWDDISKEAKDLISKLLIAKPEDRLSGDEVKKHPWMEKFDELSSNIDVKKKMREWNTKRKLVLGKVDT